MRLLLDTCVFLWLATEAPELSQRARELFVEPENEVYLSAVSVWEIAVKNSLGRFPLPKNPQRYIPQVRKAHGIAPLPLDAILTPDSLIEQYPVRVEW